MTNPNVRVRVGSEWLELGGEASEHWFQPSTDEPLSPEAKRAIYEAAEQIRNLLPRPNPEPVRITKEYLIDDGGLGDGNLKDRGFGGGGLDFLVPGQDYLLDQSALFVLQHELDTLTDRCHDLACLVRIHAYMLGLPVAWDRFGCHWEEELLTELHRTESELRELSEGAGNRRSLQRWLDTLADTGLQNEAGKGILLAVQKRHAVAPEEMHAVDLAQASLVTKLWAGVLLGRENGAAGDGGA